jgi:deoxycytidylate deaminase
VDASVERFVSALFGNPFIIPTKDECFSYVARSAALRSSDLSRQVGAAIVSPTGEILSLGCNEVPKAGGGSYWESDAFDYRDFRLGYDPNQKDRNQLIADLFFRLRKEGWLSTRYEDRDIEELMALALRGGNEAVLSEALISGLTEFGRVVHARCSP